MRLRSGIWGIINMKTHNKEVEGEPQTGGEKKETPLGVAERAFTSQKSINNEKPKAQLEGSPSKDLSVRKSN